MNQMQVFTDYFYIIVIYFIAFSSIALFHVLLRGTTRLGTARLRIFTTLVFILVVYVLLLIRDAGWFIHLSQASSKEAYTKVSYTVLWVLFAFLFDLLLRFFIWNGVLVRDGVRLVPKIMTGFVSAIIYLVMFSLMIYIVYEQSPVEILTTSGILVFVVAFAAKNSLSQIFSGLSLNFVGTVRLGEWIKVGNFKGKVKEINWRSVLLSTLSHTEVLLPNTLIANAEVERFFVSEGYRRKVISLHVKAAYNPDRVVNIMARVVNQSPYAVEKPLSRVMMKKFTGFSNQYDVHLYTREIGSIDAVDNVISAIYYAMYREDMEFSVEKGRFLKPTQKRQSYDKLIGQCDLEIVVETLKKDFILSSLPEEALMILAQHARRDCYFPHETIVKEGGEGSSLFIIDRGQVETYQRVAENDVIPMRKLSDGECFGIRAMLQGEKRRVTVRPCQKTFVYEISREGFVALLKEHPALSENLSGLLLQRIKENQVAISKYIDKNTAKMEDDKSIIKKLAKRMQQLFSSE